MNSKYFTPEISILEIQSAGLLAGSFGTSTTGIDKWEETDLDSMFE